MLQFFEPVDHDDELARPSLSLHEEETAAIWRQGVHLGNGAPDVCGGREQALPGSDRKRGPSLHLCSHQLGRRRAVIDAATVPCPHGLGSPVGRGLPPPTSSRERSYVNL